ncbi:MAG: hypothetical protein OEY93_03405 [Anaerolineae bacterium]|nr:hypothetical protein [Anaerolineae bacterium]
MDFLGIGPIELIFVFIIILIVLGPNEMVNAGTKIGNFLRVLFTSDSWKALQRASRELRTMPNKLAREAGIKELEQQIRENARIENPLEGINSIGDPALEAWTKQVEAFELGEDDDRYFDDDDDPDQLEQTEQED